MTKPEIIIRKATLEDLNKVEETCKVINQAYGPGGGWTTEEFVSGQRLSESDMKECFEQNGNPYTLLLATEEEKVVGTIQIQPSKSNEAETRLFSVAPSHQSKGIGGRLIRAALEEMKAIGKTQAVIRVFENRIEILNWYKKMGFSETGERIPFELKDRLKIEGLGFLVLKKSLLEF